ncbi:hypothetical protein BVC80_8981g30 [Macleaya cordata]|uniref:Uncharacterized protein n=1 Tax=Macleaya cordata TaxID=56857 RepID=A0A200Q7H2_MACCD|nr:hypothetical protein BVC80_8981g30 [Macleaya cordata]
MKQKKQKKKKRNREEGGGGGGGLEEKSKSDDKEERKRKFSSRSSSSSSLAARVSTDPKQRDKGTIRQSMNDASYGVQTQKQRLEAEMNRCVEESKLGETMKHEVELEKNLEVYKIKCHELSVELEKKKIECIAIQDKFGDLEIRKIAVEDELKECKAMCEGLKEWITCLEEGQKVKCEREKRAQEELRKMERVNYVQLKADNKDLECARRRAEDETEVWKKRFCELENRVLRMEEENSTLRCIESHVSRKRGLELGGLQNEVSQDDEQEKDRNKTSELQGETNGGANSAHVAHLEIKEKVLNANEKILTSGFSGPASIIMQSKPLVNVKEEKENTPLKSKVDFGSRIRKKLVTDLEGSSTKNLTLLEPGSVRPASGGIIDISDYEDKKEITPKHTCNSRGKETVHVSTDSTLKRSSDNEMDLTSKRCFKRPCSDQRGEEYWSSCEEGIPLSSTPKRTTKTLTSESESEDDDKIPICKLMMKKLEERNKGVSKLSPLNLCAGNVTLSSGGQNVEESISPSRRRLISLRQCEEKKNWWERKSRHESASPNHLRMSGISYQNAGNPSSVNGKENVAKDIGSHSEGESLGGVKWSDSSDSGDSSSDSEDATDMDLTFNQVIAMIKRNRVKESKWQFEADMLSSFEVDSELCMKAVCALYRQQISEKKLMKGSLHSNNRGFNKFDALRGTTLAEFLMDGDRKGNLKKSVKELEIFDPKALEECKRLARHYSNQLFTIYQNREDPFFLPGGV